MPKNTRPNDEREKLQPFELGEWTIDPARHYVSRGSVERRIEPKTMAVLMLLVENSPHVVTKTQLFETVWAGRFVVPGVLKRCISQLRQALGDDAKNPRYVATVPTRGYALLQQKTLIRYPATPNSDVPDTPPYRGLEVFRPQDREHYFGRDALIQEVLEAVANQIRSGKAFCLLLGPSGSGKSSLAQAGVLPQLLKQYQLAQDSYGIFRISDNRYGLLLGILTLLSRHLANSKPLSPGTVSSSIEQPEEAFEQIIDAFSSGKNTGTLQFILILDQLEEIFTSHEIEEKERKLFFELIYHLARSGRFCVLATMRNDFYAQFSSYETLRNLRKTHGHVEMRPPGSAEIGRIIREPATHSRLKFEQGEDGIGLDDVLQDAAVAHPDLLPLLEFVLLELYKDRREDGTLTFQSYHQLGGLEGSVSQRAEEIFETLPDDVQACLPIILSHLVEYSHQGLQFNAKPMALDQVSDQTPISIFISAFVEARLFSLTADSNQQHRVVRVTHEALLRNWPRAKNWLAENMSQLQSREWLANQVRRWLKEGRSTDYLLPRGKPLQRAERLLDSDIELSENTLELIRLSSLHAQRYARVRRYIGVALISLTTVAIIAAWMANQQRKLALLESERSTQVSRFLSELFLASDPGVTTGNTLTVKQLLDRGAARIRIELSDQPQVSASLMHTMGDAYRGIGSYTEANTLLSEALNLHIKDIDSHELEVAELRNTLGAVLREQGEFEDAESQLNHALSAGLDFGQSGYAQVAESYDELSMLHFLMDNGENAKIFAQKALELRHQFQSNDSQDIANSLNNLGAALASLGQLESAIAALEESVEIYARSAQPNGFRMAISLNNLGSMAYQDKDLIAAEKYFRKALTIRQQIYGDDHPDTAAMANNLSSVLRDKGHTAEALELLEKAYTVLSKEITTSHPNTALTAIKYCELQLAVGLAPDIDHILKPALATLADVYGESHWLYHRARSVYGQALHHTKALSQARPILLESSRALNEALGLESQYTESAYRRLLQFYQDAGEPENAQTVRNALESVGTDAVKQSEDGVIN